VRLAAAARVELRLLSHELDRRLYASEAFIEAVKQFVLAHPRARLRVIVNQPRVAVRNAARLLELATRASSRIELRELNPQHVEDLRGEWLIADRSLLMQRARPDSLTALLATAPAAVSLRAGHFDECWDAAMPSAELRSLAL
jgi:hypothetical protein